MNPSNGLYCETGSVSRCRYHHRFLQPEVLKLSFPVLEPWVAVCLTLQLFFLVYPCANGGPPSLSAAILPCIPSTLAACLPPTSLGECFFLNSLVVGLPYRLIFWKFGLILNWWLSFIWLCKEAKHIYLHVHLGRKPCIFTIM